MPAADDAAEIWPRLMRLRRICFRKLGLPLAECWCLKAGPDGGDIPCSEANDPTPWDLLGRPGVAKSEFVSFRKAFGDAAADELEAAERRRAWNVLSGGS